MKLKTGLLFVIIAIMVGIWKFSIKSSEPLEKMGSLNPKEKLNTHPVTVQKLESATSGAEIVTLEKSVPAPDISPDAETFYLTGGNFEDYALKCFQGLRCDFKENPFEMYRDFKKSNNRVANDRLISFLRSKLDEPEWAKRYKDPLKQMIDDFYPPEEKQFQEAAYFNYLGDLKKSLDLYLDLERKSATNPSLFPAPKLNIANTYYDLGRFREALPYYEAARADWQRPGQSEMLRFVEGRIEEITGKLSN